MKFRGDPPPLYRVHVAAHELAGGRWRIPSLDMRVASVSEQDAARFAVHLAHAKAGRIPPWRPLVRESLRHVRAQAVAGEVAELPQRREQARARAA